MHDQEKPPGMTPDEVNMLLAFAATYDRFLENEESTFETWCHNLQHIPYDDAKIAVMEYYGKTEDSEFHHPVNAAHIRKLYRSRKDLEEAKARQLQRPEPKKGPPRWYVIEQQAKGRRLNLDPMDFEDRPRPRRHDPTRERHP